jgi:hypothetical protein
LQKKTPNVPRTQNTLKDATAAKAWEAIAAFLDAPDLSRIHLFSCISQNLHDLLPFLARYVFLVAFLIFSIFRSNGGMTTLAAQKKIKRPRHKNSSCKVLLLPVGNFECVCSKNLTFIKRLLKNNKF